MNTNIKKEFKVLGIIAGIALMILGFILAFTFDGNFYGSQARDCEFGGDYYTEQYGATQKVTQNLSGLGNYIEQATAFGFKMAGLIVMALGLAVIAYFACKVTITDEYSQPTPSSASDEPVFRNIKSED